MFIYIFILSHLLFVPNYGMDQKVQVKQQPLNTSASCNDLQNQHQEQESRVIVSAQNANNDFSTQLIQEDAAVSSATFSPDGTKIAAVTSSRKIHVWDLKTGRLLHELPGYEGGAFSAYWSPSGKAIFAGSLFLQVWDIETRSLFNMSMGGWVQAFCLSQDGERMAVGNSKEEAAVYDVKTKQRLQSWNCSSVKALDFSPDGTKIVMASAGSSSVGIFEVATGKQTHNIRCPNKVYSVKWSPQGNKIALASVDEKLFICDLEKSEYRFMDAATTGWFASIIWSPDGKFLALAAPQHKVYILDLTTSKIMRTFEGHLDLVFSVDWSPTEAKIVSTSRDGTIRIWNINGAELTQSPLTEIKKKITAQSVCLRLRNNQQPEV